MKVIRKKFMRIYVYSFTFMQSKSIANVHLRATTTAFNKSLKQSLFIPAGTSLKFHSLANKAIISRNFSGQVPSAPVTPFTL